MHGGVAAILGVLLQTGLDRMLLSYDQPWKRLVLAMLVARALRPHSLRLASSNSWCPRNGPWPEGIVFTLLMVDG